MDAAGRLVVPKALRERYGLVGGVYDLEASDTPEGIVLRPKGDTVPVVRRPSGWVVFTSGAEATVDSVAEIERERRRRHDSVTGAE
jgi:bifunctional DNA-binding transcriptional regulator/antitoxin component of YhaV-PrlF toxin-antitoxin module